jgi:uncharacterized protein
MDYQAIINRYYTEDDDLRQLLIKHSRQVADRCLAVCDAHPELKLDRPFLEEAAMLHDIGIRWCHAPSIFCMGEEPYICHGLIGGRLLREAGYERHARVCERHTGTGLTRQQIVSQQLPLPPADYTPETLEEQLVCYADKFFSKSHPDRLLTVEQAARSLEKFGHEGVVKFLAWARQFDNENALF